jgi:site-specific recombinase XerD
MTEWLKTAICKHATFSAARPMLRLRELREPLLDDYRFNNYRSERRARELIENVVAFFGPERENLTGQDIAVYVRARLDAGRARATVNRELAALRRAFNIASQQGLIST